MDNALHAFSVRLNHLLLCRPPTVFVQPKLLAALAAEPEQLARRLVELKTLLPQADVASIVAQARCWWWCAGNWLQVTVRRQTCGIAAWLLRHGCHPTMPHRV